MDTAKYFPNVEDVKKASKMIRWHGFKLGHQMMVGLPESTRIDICNILRHHGIEMAKVGLYKNKNIIEEIENLERSKMNIKRILTTVIGLPIVIFIIALNAIKIFFGNKTSNTNNTLFIKFFIS